MVERSLHPSIKCETITHSYREIVSPFMQIKFFNNHTPASSMDQPPKAPIIIKKDLGMYDITVLVNGCSDRTKNHMRWLGLRSLDGIEWFALIEEEKGPVRPIINTIKRELERDGFEVVIIEE